MKKFYKVIIIINLIIIVTFLILFFKNELVGMFNSQTGMNVNAPRISFDWVAFWKKDKNKTASSTNEATGYTYETSQNTGGSTAGSNQPNTPVQEGTQSSLTTQNAQSTETTQKPANDFEKRYNALKGKTVIGINYSFMGDDPKSMAMNSDRIVKAKIKSVRTTVNNNGVFTEVVANVEKTYKGKETDVVQMSVYGGNVEASELNGGQIKVVADKSNETGDSINVNMDLCEELEEGKTYIMFLSNHNSIISPVNGNMSFYKVSWGKVTRVSSQNDKFSMRLRKFEKEYLE